MSQTKYTTLINNYFQTSGRSPASLSFEESSVGASDKAVWTVICKVNGETKGKGESSTKAEAKNQASKNALEALGQSTD
ncbi:hypothetical protein F5879DRAFT_987927 [Lentinula edodes]|uniref:uncharacterized protein n=1 Tax=Lentinula edodes TaxID=5353 RepID=UPI001E8EE9C4|nr:uncharacterized protein C8R40DRAFT_1076818 [Lentinula edodes]KAH7881170.1 hypothetical protein C8R40DRAFT_1076818 [Lentinula edodes]KAJ3879685.1 hypothetical protein F5051DRAFT_438529 [Lentinula edodes]KAJ3905834.1 hypothetical protein F5879DRAFT_987927 [Lentinula edodes]KAJ3922060.1 hypothetical protein F5877DRAFT_75616 [Lentinula edodes]